MTVLVIGTAGSGKSALAEELAVQTGDSRRYYLATMQICDEEGRKRVLKHRKQREGKGFITIERERGISGVTEIIACPGNATVLLECVTNLVGNEMYADPEKLRLFGSAVSVQEIFANEISDDIKRLADSVHNMIIVTNEYAPDCAGHDDETELYIKLLNMVNDRISSFADRIYDLRKA